MTSEAAIAWARLPERAQPRHWAQRLAIAHGFAQYLQTAPASAAGPNLRQLLLGSEDVFGVITKVTVRVRRRPEATLDQAWALPDFAAGSAALRRLAQSDGPRPGVAFT